MSQSSGWENDGGSEPDQDQNPRYPRRDRNEPKYLQDYATDCDDCDVTSTSAD